MIEIKKYLDNEFESEDTKNFLRMVFKTYLYINNNIDIIKESDFGKKNNINDYSLTDIISISIVLSHYLSNYIYINNNDLFEETYEKQSNLIETLFQEFSLKIEDLQQNILIEIKEKSNNGFVNFMSLLENDYLFFLLDEEIKELNPKDFMQIILIKKNKSMVENSLIETTIELLNDFGLMTDINNNDLSKKIDNCTILTDVEYKTNPSIGREKEIKELLMSLLVSEKSVCIVGPSGVGKTALVKGLSYKIQKNEIPLYFKNYSIIQLYVSNLISGCQYVGMLEEKFQKIMDELTSHNKLIIFIDEIHQSIGAGAGTNSNIDISSLIMPYIDSGKIKIISCSTEKEYDKYVSENSAFKRRFQVINLKEPDKEKTEEILHGSISSIEQMMNSKINKNELDTIIKLIVEATDKKNRVYSDNVNNPDLALTILKRGYASAVLDDRKDVNIQDIINSIKSESRIYESVRNKIVKELTMYNSDYLTRKENKILSFNLKKN